MTTPVQAPGIGHRVTDDVTIGRVSLNVLELLAHHLPGGDGTRLIERGVKRQWVQLVQTKKLTTPPKHGSEASAKNATGSSVLGTGAAARRKARRQRRRAEKQNQRQQKRIRKRNSLSSSAAMLATSGNFSDFEDEDWQQLIDRVSPRYWDLSREPYGQEIKNWRASPQMFSSLIMIPDSVRSGA